jgi:hypothetical protein
LSSYVQKDLVDFVQSIFDLQLNKNYINLILDFLIAVHPTSNLYLPHLKASVYFVLSPQSRIYTSPDFHIHISSGIYLLIYFYLKLFKILKFLFLFLEFHESESEQIHLNDYSETDFCGSIDSHILNTELLKLQVK